MSVVLPLSAAACASLPVVDSAPAPVPAAARITVMQSDEDDFSQLVAQLRSDLNRYKAREAERLPKLPPQTSARTRDKQFADRARELFAPLTSLRLPVVGLTPSDLEDSWGAPRDGGKRAHTGIDIFAAKGTEVIAVADGIISYIGDQPKGGHCLWLTTENGASFYYAHLDRWAPGIYEGLEVESGDLLGFVGNTGNAIHTPPHLHFGVNEGDGPVNPYPLLKNSVPSKRAHVHTSLGGGIAAK